MIREISDRAVWESFIMSLMPNTFLHAWEWGQVQVRDGEGVRYLGLYHEQALYGVALLVLVRARRGAHYLIPHGPLVRTTELLPEAVGEVVAYARQHARAEQSVALRIAPLTEDSPASRELFARSGFRSAPLHVHAELTWVLDITPSTDQLLQGMRKTTRHAIRRAEREGVQAEVVPATEALDRFWPLYEQTRTRHAFIPYAHEMLAAQLELFAERDRIFTVVARHDGRDVAAAILMHYGSTVFYYHGASVKLPSTVPAAQLVQWRALEEAKRRGATRYNFWGIARDDEPHHPFAGITTFKKGFGGSAIDYLHVQDLPLAIGYWKLWAVEYYRKWRRGF